jgi:predicted transcriptional regulator
MNQEEEAERIIEMYLPYVDNQENDIETSREVADYNTKQCALIHVNGIIEALEHHTWQNRHYIDYFEKVKSIIESK